MGLKQVSHGSGERKMGHNLNLCRILGLPKIIYCPKCTGKNDYATSDYDIDCGNPNAEDGIWNLDFYCNECDLEWSYSFRVKLESTEETI